jgi:hypothetical protein
VNANSATSVNFDQDLILVIGASGRTASHILPHLSKTWKRLRLACNSAASYDSPAKEFPVAEVVKVNLTDLNWTIVQPSHMMDSMRPAILAFASSNEPELVVTADFNAKTLFTNVVLQDLGDGVARIIEQRERHYFALYPFVFMGLPMSYEEMWESVGKMLGKPVKVHQPSFDETVSGLRKRLTRNEGEMPLDVLKAAERTLLFYNRKGLIGNIIENDTRT